MYGAQTKTTPHLARFMFENDVEMYGAQTFNNLRFSPTEFENDVEMYGAQTQIPCRKY